MRLFRKARFKIGLLALSFVARYCGPVPVSLADHERLERRLEQELKTQQENLDGVIALVSQFQAEYARLSSLLRRAAQELLRQDDRSAQFATAHRYVRLFEEKDRRLFERWQQVKRAMQKL